MPTAAFLSLFIATTASAALWPRFDPETVTLHVGEEKGISVYSVHSGLTDYDPSPRWTFGSTNEQVAGVAGELISPARESAVHITGRAPGIASIAVYSGTSPIPSPTNVTIMIVCGSEAAVTPERPLVKAYAGEEVTLRAISGAERRTTFQWYYGRLGDTSQQLAAAGAELRFTPPGTGTQYVWVSARTTCSTTAAEFRVDAVVPRRRAAR